MQQQKSSKYLISIEGVDGAGKSTIGKLLAQKLGFQYSTTPVPLYKPVRKAIDEHHPDVFSRFLFYFAATYHSIKDLLATVQEEGLVLDRYILSTKIYHEVLLGRSLDTFFKNVDFPVPHLTVVLTASSNTLKQRLKGRSQLNYIEENIDLLERIQQKFIAEKNILVIPNNGEKSPEEIVDTILQQFSKLKITNYKQDLSLVESEDTKRQ